MAGDEINALPGRPMAVSIQVETSGDTLPELRNCVLVSLDEAADVITKLTVPFLPFVSVQNCPPGTRPPSSHASAINLVPASTGSESISQRMGGFTIGSPRLASRKDGSKIKTKAVDVHLGNPVPQAVENEALHDGMVCLESVAGAGIVRIGGLIRFRM